MKVVLYDSECGFCSQAIAFIWKHDRVGKIQFAHIQSAIGGDLLRQHGVENPAMDTFYFLDGDALFIESEGALRVLGELDGAWKHLALLLIIPPGLRNATYRFIAKHRHQITWRRDACIVPPPEVAGRFLDQRND